MIMNAMHRIERYTYRDYCLWDDGQRWELIDGIPYAMAGPNLWHQNILLNLGWKFREFLVDKKCKVVVAPFDVRLNADKADDTVVQPDLIVVCDPSKLSDGKSCKGAPDLVVEILSPSTARFDTSTKLKKYREAGVKELWIVQSDPEMIQAYMLKEGDFVLVDYFSADQKIPVGILPGFEIDLADVFEVHEIAQEQGVE